MFVVYRPIWKSMGDFTLIGQVDFWDASCGDFIEKCGIQ
jgi:hypothetical protein